MPAGGACGERSPDIAIALAATGDRTFAFMMSPGDVPIGSEIEAVDVVLVEQQRRPEHDLRATDAHCAEPPGLERLNTGREFRVDGHRRGIDGEISQVARVPQHDGLDDAA